MEEFEKEVKEQIERMLKSRTDKTEYRYSLYLNGKFYGSGDLPYMTELFKDYVEICKMYGREESNFSVKRRKYKQADKDLDTELTITEDLASLVLWITRRTSSELYKKTTYGELDKILRRIPDKNNKLKEVHDIALEEIKSISSNA